MVSKRYDLGSSNLERAKKILWGDIFQRKQRSPETQKRDFLKAVPFFESLSDSEIEAVLEIMYERTYSADELLFEINHPSAALFVIQSGEVAIEIPNEDGPAALLATLKEGAFVGEMALLDKTPRSASARATHPTVALALFRTDLDKLIKTAPETACAVYKALANILSERLVSTNQLLNKGDH